MTCIDIDELAIGALLVRSANRLRRLTLRCVRRLQDIIEPISTLLQLQELAIDQVGRSQ